MVIDCDLPEEVIRDRHPGFWSYLQEGRRQGIPSGYLASRRTPWYAQERRDPAPFLCTYMGRRRPDGPPFRFFWNRSRAVAANVYLMLYPRGPLQAALAREPALGAVGPRVASGARCRATHGRGAGLRWRAAQAGAPGTGHPPWRGDRRPHRGPGAV